MTLSVRCLYDGISFEVELDGEDTSSPSRVIGALIYEDNVLTAIASWDGALRDCVLPPVVARTLSRKLLTQLSQRERRRYQCAQPTYRSVEG